MVKPLYCYLTVIALSLFVNSNCFAIERFVIARKDGWSSLTEPIFRSKARMDDEEVRPYLRVFKGDVITFIAGEGSERVVFENATSQSWEVVKGTGTLEKITDEAARGVFGHDAVMTTAKKPGELLISIKILSLEAGVSNGVFFAAFPVDADFLSDTKSIRRGILFNDPTSRNPLAAPQSLEAQTDAAMFSPYEHAWRIFFQVNDISEDNGQREWFNWMRTNTLFRGRLSDVPRWGDPPISKLWASPLADNKRINRVAFDYIVQNDLHHPEGQKKFLDEARRHADGRGSSVKVDFPRGARTMRVDWKPISFEDRFRYISMYHSGDDDDGSFAGWYGVNAIHIASKDIPTWFWCTFQHEDLVDPFISRAPEYEGNDWYARSGEVPSSFLLHGTVFEHYRLMGVQNGFTDSMGLPVRLFNIQFESKISSTSSCATCHARSTIGDDTKLNPGRLREFESAVPPTGSVGVPKPDWFLDLETGYIKYIQLDFFFSFRDAHTVPVSTDTESNESRHKSYFHMQNEHVKRYSEEIFAREKFNTLSEPPSGSKCSDRCPSVLESEYTPR